MVPKNFSNDGSRCNCNFLEWVWLSCNHARVFKGGDMILKLHYDVM